MRDVLPEQTLRRSELARRVMQSFELCGYQRVELPAFEYAAVLERGLGSLDPTAVLRFVEPETGEVVALRPDMTPQVARLVVTRLSDAPSPLRLSYQGSVLRRRHERARRHQQIPQSGVELIGSAGPQGDLEILEVATATVRAAGLDAFMLDLGHAQIATRLIESVPRKAWPDLVESLKLKDTRELVRRADAHGLKGSNLEALAALPELHGGEEVWAKADKVLLGTPAHAPMLELKRLWQAVRAADLAPELLVDLGATWAFEYYTGPMFQILAEGPGQSVGSGGRYDALYARFGAPRPAAGFALDLDNLEWAVSHGAEAPESKLRVLVKTLPADERSMLRALRGLGLACAIAPEHGALEYARAWYFSHVLEYDGSKAKLTNVSEGRVQTIDKNEPEAAARACAMILLPQSAV